MCTLIICTFFYIANKEGKNRWEGEKWPDLTPFNQVSPSPSSNPFNSSYSRNDQWPRFDRGPLSLKKKNGCSHYESVDKYSYFFFSFFDCSTCEWIVQLTGEHSRDHSERKRCRLQLLVQPPRWEAICHQMVSRHLRDLPIHSQWKTADQDISLRGIQRQCKWQNQNRGWS